MVFKINFQSLVTLQPEMTGFMGKGEKPGEELSLGRGRGERAQGWGNTVARARQV